MLSQENVKPLLSAIASIDKALAYLERSQDGPHPYIWDTSKPRGHWSDAAKETREHLLHARGLLCASVEVALEPIV